MKKILFIINLAMLLVQNRDSYSISTPAQLKNLGATCYMNSVLQCLYQIHPLTDFLLSSNAASLYEPNSIALKYIDFIRKVPLRKINAKEMNTLCYPVFNTFFSGSSGQQDASEFLNQFLDRLGDEDIKAEERRLGKFIPGTSVKKNEITQLFFSLMEETIKPKTSALMCPSVDKMQGSGSIDLAIGAPKPKTEWENLNEYQQFSKSAEGLKLHYQTLTECLKIHTSPELLTGDNNYRCADDTRVDAYKSLHFEKAPPFLILVLKRFDNIKTKDEAYIKKHETDRISVKETHAVSFSLKDFDLKPYMSKDSKQIQTKYDLISFVQQSGSLNGGHYTSYVKSNNNWFYCNDEEIISKSESDIKVIADKGLDSSFTPYILFYKRQDITNEKDNNKPQDSLSSLEVQLQSLFRQSITLK